ncbi:MAG: hypothetical protein N2606_04220, partial [Candidatus Omnitrophica bacterium]|nr:hypothetical protein [Candidatus Omnitrophota bacterium]
MALCFDYSWMSLNKASKFLGAQLDIANAVYNMLKDAKDVKLAKKFTVLLWDTAKKQFVVEVSLDRKVKVVPPLKKSLRKIWQLNKPLILKDKVILPLKETATTFGALVIRSKTVYTRRSEEIITFAQALTTAIANLKVFIDSERRSQDMFRFNVLSRALNPTVH